MYNRDQYITGCIGRLGKAGKGKGMGEYSKILTVVSGRKREKSPCPLTA